MKGKLLTSVLVFILIQFGCKEKPIDMPDIQSIYKNITYLDSLFQSRTVDSISTERDKLENLIASYKNNIRTAEEKIFLDSLAKIGIAANDFLRFCNDSRIDLELLHNDVVTVENQYKSGKIKIDNYMSALLESEQIQVNLNQKYFQDLESVISSLRNRDLIVQRLSPDIGNSSPF